MEKKPIITKRVKFYNVNIYRDGTIWISNYRTGHITVIKGDTRRGAYMYFRFVHKQDAPHFIKKCHAHGVTPPPVIFRVINGETPCAMYYNAARQWS